MVNLELKVGYEKDSLEMQLPITIVTFCRFLVSPFHDLLPLI